MSEPGRTRRGSGGPAGKKAQEKGQTAAPPDPAQQAKDICYRLLTVRARTRLELEQALRSKGIPDDVAESTLGKFDRAGLIDDASFAETWVRSRHEYQGLGRRALKAELRRKGVTDDVAAEAVDMVDADAEEERARGLVRKKLRAMGAADEQTKVRRLVGMLARKGYSEGLSFRIVREELSYLDPETTLLDDTLIE